MLCFSAFCHCVNYCHIIVQLQHWLCYSLATVQFLRRGLFFSFISFPPLKVALGMTSRKFVIFQSGIIPAAFWTLHLQILFCGFIHSLPIKDWSESPHNNVLINRHLKYLEIILPLDGSWVRILWMSPSIKIGITYLCTAFCQLTSSKPFAV